MGTDTSDEERAGLPRRIAEALEHPVRARMFGEMTREPLGEDDLAARVEIPPARARYHYRVLERVGGVRAAEELRRGGSA
jgi:DNA-binding transcriptional ArsR family regulator